MLLALCHRCWTWIEPKHDRCVECGSPVELEDPDPASDELQSVFGTPLFVLGEVSLNRAKLPSFGPLSAYTDGLLFLTDLRTLPRGGIVAADHAPRNLHGLPGFWNRLVRRQGVSPGNTERVRPCLPAATAVTSFFNSPGAMFIPRAAIVRIQHRGSLLRVERKPGRTVAWHIESSPSEMRDGLLRLKADPAWCRVAM